MCSTRGRNASKETDARKARPSSYIQGPVHNAKKGRVSFRWLILKAEAGEELCVRG